MVQSHSSNVSYHTDTDTQTQTQTQTHIHTVCCVEGVQTQQKWTRGNIMFSIKDHFETGKGLE